MPLPRKNIRLPAANYRGKRQYFITICCHERKPLLAADGIAPHVIEQLRSTAANASFSIHAYCAMPDHFHLLAEGMSDKSHLLAFMHAFKQQTEYDYHWQTGRPLWQFKFYDHILRSAVAMDDVAWYIWMNPVRKGLCADPRDYAHAGSFTQASLRLSEAKTQWTPPWKKAV
jgi:putative transposase